MADSQDDKVLNLYAWAEYFPSAVLEKFKTETGIKVNYASLDSNDVAETTLSAGHSGFDLVTVNASPHLGRQIPKGLWLRLDRARISNWGNVDPKLLQIMQRVDPQNAYAIPYVWGTTGIIFNPQKIHAIMADAPVDSLAMLFEPNLAARFKSCGISVLDSWVDILPMISLYLGRKQLDTEPQSLADISETFARVRPFIRRINTPGYYDQLARGELCLSLGYSADAMSAQRLAAQLHSGVQLEYRQPREGIPMYIDAFAIPADSRHADAALRFIDFVLRPEIGVELAQATSFAIANTAAMAQLSPELRNNPMIYPSSSASERLSLDRAFSMEETRLLSRTWLRMKTGH
ncbi:MAG: extracellular solute-binding protein [Steroidobacteraceae bacterium]|jgi:putrescine transport system substrate-binding protein